MHEVLKKMCDNMLRYGEITNVFNYVTANHNYISVYEIKYVGEIWLLIKVDGEWVLNWHIFRNGE